MMDRLRARSNARWRQSVPIRGELNRELHMDLSVADDQDRTNRSSLDPFSLLLFATVLFGVSVRASSPAAGLAVALATVLAGVAFWVERSGAASSEASPHRMEVRLYLAVLVFSLLGLLWWAPAWIGPTRESLERLPALAWGVIATWLFFTRDRIEARRLCGVVTVLTLALTLAIGIWNVVAAEGIGVDVYLLHQSAADAIGNGLNPYTDVVEVPNGAPTASPEDTIVGYPYPPVAALAYSLGQWSFGDPRYTSLACWLVVLGLIGLSAYRRRDRRQLYVLLLLASIPGWPLVLRAGWTEPLTLMFLVIAFLTWRRPAGSGIGLGLGLASKQYFVIAAPLALLHRDRIWLRRLLIAAAAIALTVGPALIADPASFWRSAVEFHTNTPLRTDSVNIVGFIDSFGGRWEPPRWLGPAVGVAIAAIAGKFSRSRRSFFIGMAVSLAASFLVASQAFANYWFLITGLCALVLSSSASAELERAGGEPGSSG